MENPYQILQLQQDATKKDILKAKMLAMKEKKYSLQIITNAAKQLLTPSSRLAADFLCPSKIKSKRPRKIKINFKKSKINEIDVDALDSLK